jgi:hypothetical protein
MSGSAAVILLGAGASYGSGETYFGKDFKTCRNPPLGSGLFDELERAGGLERIVSI